MAEHALSIIKCILLRTVESIGAILSNIKTSPPDEHLISKPSEALVVQIDGGHIKPKEQGKRSIEAIATKIYQLKKVVEIDKHHTGLKLSTTVASALSDKRKNIKQQTQYAAKLEGMTEDTIVYLL